MHDFEFNGTKLSELGAVITERPRYPIAMRDISMTSVLGRSGDAVVDNGRYKNVEISYSVCSVPNIFFGEQNFVYKLSEWLFSSHEYCILRDTYNPGYFRKAVAVGIDTPTSILNGAVSTKVKFSCDPFLYRDDGLLITHVKYLYNEGMSKVQRMLNPESWESQPIIKIYGAGDYVLSFYDESGYNLRTRIEISGLTNGIVFDKVKEDIYDLSGVPCNDKVNVLKIPRFAPGLNTLMIGGTSGNDLEADIIPNWRRL